MQESQPSRPSIAQPETTPSFTCEEAEAIVLKHYGLSASASELPSERDQNFRVNSQDGKKFVLKIANAEEDYDVLDFQSGAFEHARKVGVSLELPRLMISFSGKRIG